MSLFVADRLLRNARGPDAEHPSVGAAAALGQRLPAATGRAGPRAAAVQGPAGPAGPAPGGPPAADAGRPQRPAQVIIIIPVNRLKTLLINLTF